MDVHFTLTDIKETALQFLKTIGEKKVVAFHGEMGAGKTTLIHALCDTLSVKDAVSSPTFSIINEYITGDRNSIFHIDLYRLKNEAEAINAGVEDCLNSHNLCLVEWPEIAPGLFPPDTVHCFISIIGDNERKLVIR